MANDDDYKRQTDSPNDTGEKKADESDFMKNWDKCKTTETDMFFEYFTNREKLVEPDNPKKFEKPDKKHDDYSDDRRGSRDSHHYSDGSRHADSKYDDSRYDESRYDDDKYKDDKYKDSHYDSKYDSYYDSAAPPKPSSAGPSYGDGPSHAAQHSEREFETDEDEMLAKLDMLRKLGELTQHGVKLSQSYNMNSDYKSMKYEHELHTQIRAKHNGVKWMSNMMLNVIWGLEMANDKFNPFDIHLKGWSEQVNDDIDSYYDPLSELYEKYFKGGKSMPPELKLMFMISGSAIKFHMTHSLINSAPNIGDFIKGNPGLAAQMHDSAISDRAREQANKQRETFMTRASGQHGQATQQAADLQMLHQQQEEYMRMQQEQRQAEVDELQRQLALQRSDTASAYTNNSHFQNQQTMRPAHIPNSLRGRYPTNAPVGNMYDNLQNPNGNISPAQVQELLRQQSILEQKDRLAQRDINRLNINPELDDIIVNKFHDDRSQVSEGGVVDRKSRDYRDDYSEKSGKSNKSRGRKKTTGMKVNTN